MSTHQPVKRTAKGFVVHHRLEKLVREYGTLHARAQRRRDVMMEIYEIAAAGQPKLPNIGEDAHFLELLRRCEIEDSQRRGLNFQSIIGYIHQFFDAPAAQAPAEVVRNNVPGSPHNVCRTTEHNLRKRIAELEAQASATIQPGQWVRCTPDLLKAGVSCHATPRRPGDGTYSHDHFIAHSATIQVAPDVHANPTPEMQRAREVMEKAEKEADNHPYGTPGWRKYERAYGDAITAYGESVKGRVMRATIAVEPTWDECERISNLPEVDEAMRGFSDDPTGDNGVCIVIEVIKALGIK